ncbi:MAG: ATP-binding protein [Desulfobacterales bacterium]|nr:MAG: ATP-binding protein [Desulfobacterales bacterium]
MRATQWYVITGAPCSGKTAVIHELERRGYAVVHEVARAYIDQELKKGKRLDQIRADELAFERHILREKLKIEKKLAPDAIHFLDRAVPDSIAYFKLAGLDPEEPLKKSEFVRYKKVFVFERLGFLMDNVRCEDEETAAQLDRLIQESYRLLKYDLVIVPACRIKDRANFVLQHL